MGNIVVASVNEAKIISGARGNRVLVGQCGLAIWCVEECNSVNLEVMTLELYSKNAESAKGVKINVKGIAQVKVNSGPTGAVDTSQVELFAKHFLGMSQDEIAEAIKVTLEGHQRQIIGELTVEDIYKNRQKFSQKVRNEVAADLNALGVAVASYVIVDINDDLGYMENLGKEQAALNQRNADEGAAKHEAEAAKSVAANRSEAEQATSKSAQEAHTFKAHQHQAMVEADRDLSMKREAANAEINEAREKAEAAGRIQKAIQDQEVARQLTQQKVVEAEVLRKVTEQEIERKKSLLAGESEAELLKEANEAKAVKVKAEAESDRIRSIGTAEADAIQKKGEAEAEVLAARARAYNEYGDAAIVPLLQNAVAQMPAIAKAMAEPLKATEKMIFISQDGSAGSQLSKDITKMVAEVPEVVDAITGVDLKKVFKRITSSQAGA